MLAMGANELGWVYEIVVGGEREGADKAALGAINRPLQVGYLYY